MEPSLAGGRSCHQQNQPKYRNKANAYGNNGMAAQFLQFPPPPNYPPTNDRIGYDGRGEKKMHRCPNDLDRIEMLSSSPTEPYDRRSDGMGGVGGGVSCSNGIGKFHNNIELQVSFMCRMYIVYLLRWLK